MKKKIFFLIVILLLIAIISSVVFILVNNSNQEVRSIKSEAELLKIYEGNNNDYDEDNTLLNIFTMPFSILSNLASKRYYSYNKGYVYDVEYDAVQSNSGFATSALESIGTKAETSTYREYSTTNIQVENVDEADIIKTDGNYIYSISENNVVITDVRDENNVKIASKIEEYDNMIPEELILYKNVLVVILAKMNSSSSYYNSKNDTIVEIYDITNRENPKLLKDYELLEPYYTSRCIDNRLYVISCGNLRKEKDKVITYYTESSVKREIGLDNIKCIKDIETKRQTLISTIDLNDVNNSLSVSSYLMDVSNAYVSENSIYLLNTKYDYNYNSDVPPVSSIFGPAGIFGAFSKVFDDRYDYNSGYKTSIYKFDISKDGKVDYKTKTKLDGQTINQYSLDEKDGHLRIALYDSEGTRIVILDNSLNEIGRTSDLAKGEKMYSSRFVGNKAYLVTYKTVDPLFVIDLSDEKNPTVLGKLKIPGYSTYLHPYDENHIIGIGMETEEIINRNSSGKVTSTRAVLKGMKMALFDVTDVNNPKQISSVVIGDSRTSSAILTNPKALLFSKEKALIAIPVNNYTEDFEISVSNTDSYDTLINSYKNYTTKYVAEGYFVYNINLEEGLKLKGVITHEKVPTTKYYYYYNYSKLLRGVYIDNNLFTVSEDQIKVNNLDTLEQITELKIK